MLAIGLGEGKYSSSELALEGNWGNAIEEVNHLVYNLVQGECEGFSLASPDEEAIDHLLVEQHVVGTLDDDVMYFSSKSLDNCFNRGGIPCSSRCYDEGDDFGILDANAEQVEKQPLKYEFMLQGDEDNENIHAAYNLSCNCSDFLLESGPGESFLLDYPSNNEATFINMKSSRQIQCTERGSEVKSVFPCIAQTFTVTELQHSTVPPYSLDILGCNDATDSLNVPLEDKKWLKHGLLFDQQKFTGLSNASDLMESAFLSIQNEDDMILIPGSEMSESAFSSLLSISHHGALVAGAEKDEVPCVDAQSIEDNKGTHSEETNNSFLTTKRIRKPTKRYIEETSEIKNRCSYERLKASLSKGRLLNATKKKNYHWSYAMKILNQDYSGLHSLRARQRKITKKMWRDSKGCGILPSKITLNYDPELEDDVSDECATTHCQRRKHHRQWTLSEVVKLVDGVSHFGVGRWTDIKRLCFSDSAYRTAVDLKDKWRNLLRASVADSEERNQVETQQKKHASSAYIPQSVLQQVRELSIIYPYPRSQKLKFADLPPTSPPTSTRSRNGDEYVVRRSRNLRYWSSSK